MNDIYSFDFVQKLPRLLKEAPEILTLAKVISEQLKQNIELTQKGIIYANIDGLEEEILDILAYDLHVEWYDYGYDLAAKRETIKNSILVHRYKGTKYSVETALQSVLGESGIDEWFEYGGKPHRFRVYIDTTQPRPMVLSEAIKNIGMYKRLSSWLDGIIIQARANIVVETQTKNYHFYAGVCGNTLCGTVPDINNAEINNTLE